MLFLISLRSIVSAHFETIVQYDGNKFVGCNILT